MLAKSLLFPNGRARARALSTRNTQHTTHKGAVRPRGVFLCRRAHVKVLPAVAVRHLLRVRNEPRTRAIPREAGVSHAWFSNIQCKSASLTSSKRERERASRDVLFLSRVVVTVLLRDALFLSRVVVTVLSPKKCVFLRNEARPLRDLSWAAIPQMQAIQCKKKKSSQMSMSMESCAWEKEKTAAARHLRVVTDRPQGAFRTRFRGAVSRLCKSGYEGQFSVALSTRTRSVSRERERERERERGAVSTPWISKSFVSRRLEEARALR